MPKFKFCVIKIEEYFEILEVEDLSDREKKFAEKIKDLCKEYLELTETQEEDAEI